MVDMRKGDHKDYAQRLQAEYDAPVYFKSLSAFESAEDEYMSVFRLLNEHRNRVRTAERAILPKYRTLVASICSTLGSPLSEAEWNGAELFSGDDFWGDVEIPLAAAEVASGEANTHAEVNN